MGLTNRDHTIVDQRVLGLFAGQFGGRGIAATSEDDGGIVVNNKPLLEFLQEVSFPDQDWSCLPAGYRERYGPDYTSWETPGGWIYLHKDEFKCYGIARGHRKEERGTLQLLSYDYTVRHFALSQSFFPTIKVYPVLGVGSLLRSEDTIRIFFSVWQKRDWELSVPRTSLIATMAFQVVSWRMPLGIYLDWLQDWLADILPEEAEKLQAVLAAEQLEKSN